MIIEINNHQSIINYNYERQRTLQYTEPERFKGYN